MKRILCGPYFYLGIIITAAVGLRIVMPYTTVFGEYIKFISPDCYYNMGVANDISAVFPVRPLLGSVWPWLLVAVAWVYSGGNITKEILETVAVFLPPVIAGATIYFIYLIGSRLFNNWVGVIAVAVVSFMPGEFFGRSVLGAVDHHVVEVFFTTGAMAFIVLAWKSKGWGWFIYTALGSLLLVAYITSWQGYRLFILILGIYALILLAIWFYRRRSVYLSVLTLVSCTVLTWLSGVPQSLYNSFHMSPLTLTTTTESLNTLGFEGIAGLILPKCLIALLILLPLWKYKNAGDMRWLLIVWTLVIVGAVLWQRRFVYYLAIPLSLLIGFIVWRGYESLVTGCTGSIRRCCKGLAVFAVGIIVAICLVITVPGAKSGYRTPSDDWQGALEWVRDNTPADTLVVTWWDYGHWVVYIAERESYIAGGQGEKVKDVARLFNSSQKDMLMPLYKDRATFVILDSRTVYELTGSIRAWDNNTITAIPLSQRLYEGYVDGFDLVYDSDVKVFEVVER